MDYSARLKKRHLMDLITYMKTSKHGVKPADEEDNESEQAQKDFIESCLFIGLMPEEDDPNPKGEEDHKMDTNIESEESKNRVYDPTIIKYEGINQYEKVWSETLMNQIQLSTTRFFKYIESPEAIKTEEISKFKKEWMSKALDLIPDHLL